MVSGRIRTHPLFWHALVVAVLFAVSVYPRIATFDNFQSNISTDAVTSTG